MTTLAEVLRALDDADPDALKLVPLLADCSPQSVAPVCIQYILANREALERWEWRCAVVAAVEPPGDALTGVYVFTYDEARTFAPHWSRTQDNTVCVGADWRPEVKP